MEALQQTEQQTISGLAAVCLVEAKGDRVRAVQMFKDSIERNGMKDALLDRFYDQAAWDAIRNSARALRVSFWTEAASPNQDDPSGLDAVGKAHEHSLLNEWCLSSGVTLGDATGEHIDAELSLHLSLAHSNGKKAAFYRHVRKSVKGKKSVRECLTEADVRQIIKRVKLPE